jgi:hypothetical protein
LNRGKSTQHREPLKYESSHTIEFNKCLQVLQSGSCQRSLESHGSTRVVNFTAAAIRVGAV